MAATTLKGTDALVRRINDCFDFRVTAEMTWVDEASRRIDCSVDLAVDVAPPERGVAGEAGGDAGGDGGAGGASGAGEAGGGGDGGAHGEVMVRVDWA